VKVSWRDVRGPVVAAHRGLSAEHPENTSRSFQAAVEAGFDSLELDLRVTHDGEVVALHDPSLNRTTDGAGRVADMAYDELRAYDAGGGPVPRFDDLLSRHGGRALLWNMETKVLGAVAPAIRLLEHHRLVPKVLHMSFQPGQLARSQDLLPELARGLLLAHPPKADDFQRARRLGCDWVVGEHGTWDHARIRRAHDAGLRAGAYTVNDPARALQLVEWGLECVITDRRDVLAAVRSQTRSPVGAEVEVRPA